MSFRKLLLVGQEPLPGRLIAFCAILGFFAGVSKALLNRNPLTTWKDIAAGAMASAVSATIVGSAAFYALGADKAQLVIPIAGVAGWLGAALLDYLASLALSRVQEKLGGSAPSNPSTTNREKDHAP